MRDLLPRMLFAALVLAVFTVQTPAAEPPKSWIDPDTGHRVVRLTDEPGSATPYFKKKRYTADGRKLIYKGSPHFVCH